MDLYGQPMSQVYTGMFSIAWTTVQGSITDTNGLPVPDVVVQSDGGGAAATTDTNGNYVLAVPPGGTGHRHAFQERAGVCARAPAPTRDVTTPITNENYLAVTSVMPTLATQVQTNSLILSWYGIPGVTYQPLLLD